MPDQPQPALHTLLLHLLPADHTTVGNITLLEQFLAAAQAAGHQPPATEDDFKIAREALVAAGLAVKGKGRGGATARATGAQRPDFALDAPTAPAPTPTAAAKPPKAAKAKPTPESAKALAAVRWCRDPDIGGNAGLYRQNSDTENYLLAMGDNGNGIWVGPDPGAKLIAMTEKDTPAAPRYSITLMTAAQNIGFVTQDRLPSPQRVIEIVKANRRVTTVPTWGKSKSIGVNSDAL